MNELSIENLKDILHAEGFVNVYEWSDKPGQTYPSHKHQGKVSMYIVKGSVEMNFPDKTINLKTGDRLDVPVAVEHTATVGKDGCEFVVGEQIKGDS